MKLKNRVNHLFPQAEKESHFSEKKSHEVSKPKSIEIRIQSVKRWDVLIEKNEFQKQRKKQYKLSIQSYWTDTFKRIL